MVLKINSSSSRNYSALPSGYTRKNDSAISHAKIVGFCSIVTILLSTVMALMVAAMVLSYGNCQVDSNVINWPEPPPHAEIAKVARYITHISDWGSLATISAHDNIVGFPFANVLSVSDGPVLNTSGIPYFYLPESELSALDLQKDNRASLSLSLAQSGYCKRSKFDQQDPRCAHITLSGTMLEVAENSSEEVFARFSLFSRHPEMADWPADHNWFFAKLNISHIYVLDYFGAAKVLSVEEYFDAKPF